MCKLVAFDLLNERRQSSGRTIVVVVRLSPLGILVAGAMLPLPATAAPPITVERAVDMALARAPEVRAARGEHAAVGERVRQARSAYLPRLSLNGGYMVWWPKNALELPAGVPIELPAIDSYHHVNAGLEAGIRLVDLSRGARVDAARQAASAAGAGIRETEVGLAFQVRATFLAALFSRDVTRIAGESSKLARRQEQQARLRAEVGTGSQVALAQTRVRGAQLEAQLRQSESELERYRRQLASLVGLPPGRLPSLEGDLELLSRPVPSRQVEQNPTLVKLRASREAALLTAKSTARSLVPTLDLFAKAEVEYPHRMKVEWGPLIQGGLRLSWPFFEGGVRWSRLREARARSEGLQAAEQAAREKLARRLIDLGARARTAEADLTSARATQKQTEVYLRVARAAVAAGTGTDLDVHQAELGVDQTRIAVRKALLALAVVRAETLAVCGITSSSRKGGNR